MVEHVIKAQKISGHLVYVVLQNPVTDPVQRLNQAELRFHIFCFLLFTGKQWYCC